MTADNAAIRFFFSILEQAREAPLCLGPAGFSLLKTFGAAVERTKIDNLHAVEPDRFATRKQPCDELTVEIGVAKIAVKEEQEDS